MKQRDVIGLAASNLRRQLGRNILNIAGVFIGCLLLLITLAGTRGVGSGIQQFLDQNQLLRRIQFYVDFEPSIPVPAEVTQVDGQMSDARRSRIRHRLKRAWRQEHQNRNPADARLIRNLEALPHVVEVFPSTILTCQIELDDSSLQGRSLGISANDAEVGERILYGQSLDQDDESGALINEFTAWKMGWRDDLQLAELVGQTLTVTHQVSGRQLGQFLNFLSGGIQDTELSDTVSFVDTIQQLLDEMDATSLSEQQKQLLRDRMRIAIRNDNRTGELIAVEQFRICGVFRHADDHNSMLSLASAITDDHPDLYVNHPVSTRLFLADPDNDGFWSGTVEIDHYRNLKTVESQMEELGLLHASPSWLLERLDQQIVIVRASAAGIAIVIFFIVSIGIANSMTISVMQRTSEFGIMKALGARDAGIVRMMLLEGGLTGLAGAAMALAVSLVTAWLLNDLVRERWLDELGDAWDAQIFQFSPGDIILVVLISVGVTTLAAVLPARRAARLDPVEAMRR